MPIDKTIRDKVEELIKKNEMFTSMDVANAIKRDGVWVRNREVRDWLHAAISNEPLLFGSYAHTTISVCGGSAQATLYYPVFADPDDYVERNQIALTPNEVKAIAKQNAGKPISKAVPDINAIFSNTNDEVASTVIRSVERVKIPGNFIKRLGWQPGDVVDPAAILTHKALPGTLKVSKDYRVSVPRTCINWGISPVKVILKKDNTIVFDKA